MRRALWVAVALLLVAPAAGCESTQSKSRRLESQAKKLDRGKGVVVKKENPQVKIVSTSTLRDANGEAVVVRMRNVGARPLARMPIAVELADAGGKPVYRNDTPGLEDSLVQVSLLAPGQDLWWVNDQVTATGRPARATALVGTAQPAPGAPPRITLAGVHLEADSVSGVSAIGRALNDSNLEQRRLPIFCVARRGQRVVAAGRAIIDKLKPRKPTRFTVFFIGDPRGAELTLAATPTVLEGKAS